MCLEQTRKLGNCVNKLALYNALKYALFTLSHLQFSQQYKVILILYRDQRLKSACGYRRKGFSKREKYKYWFTKFSGSFLFLISIAILLFNLPCLISLLLVNTGVNYSFICAELTLQNIHQGFVYHLLYLDLCHKKICSRELCASTAYGTGFADLL